MSTFATHSGRSLLCKDILVKTKRYARLAKGNVRNFQERTARTVYGSRFEDAKPCLELRIAKTFILEADDCIAAYFCLLNDKISKDEVIGSRWKKIKSNFPRDKQFRSYPTIKIGRFAVSLDFRGRQIGTDLMGRKKSAGDEWKMVI